MEIKDEYNKKIAEQKKVAKELKIKERVEKAESKKNNKLKVKAKKAVELAPANNAEDNKELKKPSNNFIRVGTVGKSK